MLIPPGKLRITQNQVPELHSNEPAYAKFPVPAMHSWDVPGTPPQFGKLAGFCQRHEDQEFSGMTGAAATASPLVTGTFPAGHGNYSVSEKEQEQPNTRADTKLG